MFSEAWFRLLTPAIRGWFATSGLTEVAFDTAEGFSWRRHHRLTGSPRPFEPGRRLFHFDSAPMRIAWAEAP